jgi:hypothetical protein
MMPSYKSLIDVYMKRPQPPSDRTVLLPRPHDIRQFQRFHNLPVTGIVDAPTKRKMRQVNTTMATGALGYGGPH